MGGSCNNGGWPVRWDVPKCSSLTNAHLDSDCSPSLTWRQRLSTALSARYRRKHSVYGKSGKQCPQASTRLRVACHSSACFTDTDDGKRLLRACFSIARLVVCTHAQAFCFGFVLSPLLCTERAHRHHLFAPHTVNLTETLPSHPTNSTNQ